MIGGLIRQGVAASQLRAVEIDPHVRSLLWEGFNVASYGAAEDVPALGDLVVLAVKPPQMQAATSSLKPWLRNQAVLSIAAGIRIASISRWLGGYANVIRCMPNTPAIIGAGVTAVCGARALAPELKTLAEQALRSVGSVLWIDEEPLLDAVTAVSGSGPAYVFYFMEALRQAALELGLSSATAKTLAVETFSGAAKLALNSDVELDTLRDRVTSKGGTTEAALNSMNRDRVKEGIIRAIKAAQQRAIEIGADQEKH
jgi:pyrroline-5-carboxylate reductase